MESNDSKAYYYPYLIGRYKNNHFDTVKFFHYIKSLFFDNEVYKWKPTQYKIFIIKNDLKFEDVYNVLSNVKNSKKGFKSFLQKIEKYNNTKSEVKIKPKNINSFLKDLQVLRDKHLNINTLEFVDFINSNFETPYTQSTLLRKFYDKEYE